MYRNARVNQEDIPFLQSHPHGPPQRAPWPAYNFSLEPVLKATWSFYEIPLIQWC